MMLDIEVELIKVDENHFLVFKFEEELKLDLRCKESATLKTLFGDLIKNLLQFEYTITLKNTEVEEVLVVEVAKKYVEQLKTDLLLIKESDEYKILKKY